MNRFKDISERIKTLKNYRDQVMQLFKNDKIDYRTFNKLIDSINGELYFMRLQLLQFMN